MDSMNASNGFQGIGLRSAIRPWTRTRCINH